MNYEAIFGKNTVFKRLGLTESHLKQVLSSWHYPHRFYHNLDHLDNILLQIEGGDATKSERELLEIAALFHDAVYDPRQKNNEDMSLTWFLNKVENPSCQEAQDISHLILSTKNPMEVHPGLVKLCDLFNSYDFSDFYFPNGQVKLMEGDRKIFKEYQFHSLRSYRTGRLSFLRGLKEQNDHDVFNDNVDFLIRHNQAWKPKVGIYAGSFNPFHIGHMAILEKAERIFDKVVIAIGRNPNKNNNLEVMAEEVKSVLPFHEVVCFDNLLTEYITDLENYADVTIVRGLRSGYDLNKETNQLRFMEDLKKNINVVYINCDRQHQHVSSSGVRDLAAFDNIYAYKYRPKKYAYANEDVGNSSIVVGN